MGLKTGDLDIDLQGEIGLETSTKGLGLLQNLLP